MIGHAEDILNLFNHGALDGEEEVVKIVSDIKFHMTTSLTENEYKQMNQFSFDNCSPWLSFSCSYPSAGPLFAFLQLFFYLFQICRAATIFGFFVPSKVWTALVLPRLQSKCSKEDLMVLSRIIGGSDVDKLRCNIEDVAMVLSSDDIALYMEVRDVYAFPPSLSSLPPS